MESVMPVVYGKLYMKDPSGNVVQIVPDGNPNISDYQGATDLAVEVILLCGHKM